MTTFQILWIIAGFFIGNFGCQFLFAAIKVQSPRLMDIIAGLIGSLITYTILR